MKSLVSSTFSKNFCSFCINDETAPIKKTRERQNTMWYYERNQNLILNAFRSYYTPSSGDFHRKLKLKLHLGYEIPNITIFELFKPKI